MQCVFSIFGCLYYIIVLSDIFEVLKRVVGQESHPYAFCLGVTFQGQN